MADSPANILTEKELCVAFSIIIVLLPVIILLCAKVIVPFIDERKYIKMEIDRSTSSSERRYWKKELKKLYFGNIPLIGRLFR